MHAISAKSRTSEYMTLGAGLNFPVPATPWFLGEFCMDYPMFKTKPVEEFIIAQDLVILGVGAVINTGIVMLMGLGADLNSHQRNLAADKGGLW